MKRKYYKKLRRKIEKKGSSYILYFYRFLLMILLGVIFVGLLFILM